MLTFQETLEYLYSRLPMYQRIGKSAFKKDLTNTYALMEGLGNPHKKLKTVHVAGSNGKGTTAHAIAAVLQEAGYKTGLYTSPHLKSFTERIKINGREISKSSVVRFVDHNKDLIESINPSFFEVTVAMAFDHFSVGEVDIAVIETGLGGRLDSTNVIIPELSVITNISLEHTDLLGDTIEKIAFEKAGIIKPGIPVVVGALEDSAMAVMEEISSKGGSKLVRSRVHKHELDLSNCPPYFELNLPAVFASLSELRLKGWRFTDDQVQSGIENFQKITKLKGRFQSLRKSPQVIADISHNQDGLRILIEAIRKREYENLHIIFGSVLDKDLGPILSQLPKEALYYFTSSSVPRRLPESDLKNAASNLGLLGGAYENVNLSLKAALREAESNDLILVTGSTFVVAELDDL